MNIQDIHQQLVSRFGAETITGLKTEALDPWIEVASEAIGEVSLYLRDDSDLVFDSLNNLTAVDYLETDEKLAAKFPYDPHLEVVYHLYSYTHRHSLTVKVRLPRWKRRDSRRASRGAQRGPCLGHCRLARARGV